MTEVRSVRNPIFYEMMNSNKVSVSGKMVGEIIYSHRICGEGFYTVFLEVRRLSGTTDVIPLMISDRLIDVKQDYDGQIVEIRGEFRSYNYHKNSKNKLLLFVFAQEIKFVESAMDDTNNNHIQLDGYLCQKPNYRETPFERHVTDLMVAVNRPYNKSDYIPCVVWGRSARYASGLQVGDHIEIQGRIQSREYIKKIGEDQIEKRIAYEVFVSGITCKKEDGML